MAATVSSPWSKPGAWALDAEENEAELSQNKPQAAVVEESAEFPSLAAAAAAKPKKKKGQKVSLAEFTAAGSEPTEPKGLTTDELLALPTGPRQRPAEELDRNRLGGGFKNYGTGRYGDDSSRWGSGRGSDEGRRQGGFGRDASRESLTSRADEVDNWGAVKKSGAGGGFERRERDRGFFGDSKADEVDNWNSGKSEGPRRFGGFERDRRGPRVGFELSGGADSDNWAKKKEEIGNAGSANVRPKVGFGTSGGADSDNWGRKNENGGSGGSANGRPRLVLQPRTLPASESKPEVVKPKGSNPFGEARPREEVLKEKGKDWKEIDEKLESIKIKEKDTMVEREGRFGKRGFGLGSGRGDSPDEKTWRKPEAIADERPQSAERTENGDHEAKSEN